MLLFFAESCGRWGCTWQEGVLTLLLMALFTTDPIGIIFILALVILAIGSVVLGIADIYETITDLISPKEKRKQKELEVQIEARSAELTVNSIKRFFKFRQHSQNQENSVLKVEEPKISSAVKPLRAIFNRKVQSMNKNKASQ